MGTPRIRTFRVATFADERGRISCYTLWYNAAWPGCIEYDVKAESGVAAKKLAKALRKEHEAKLETACTTKNE